MTRNPIRIFLFAALLAIVSASGRAALAFAAPWSSSGAEPGPRAADNAYRVQEDAVLARSTGEGVLANDVEARTATLLADVAHGTLTLDSDGSFVYRLAPDFSGADSFTYRAGGGAGEGDVAKVTITVDPANDPPLAAADAYALAEDGTLEVPAAAGVLANDRDAESDALAALLLSDVEHGTLTLESDGSFSYTPARDFTGRDAFTYRANDGTNDSDAATVTIAVGAHNDAPVAVGEAYSVAEDGTLTISAAGGVLANDTDADGNALTALLEDDVRHGTLKLSADGSFTYRPKRNFSGTDSFAYRASDGSASGNPATVSIIVTAVDDVPVAVNDSYSVTENGTLNRPAGLGVLANDADPDGGGLSATLVRSVSNGTLSPDPPNPQPDSAAGTRKQVPL